MTRRGGGGPCLPWGAGPPSPPQHGVLRRAQPTHAMADMSLSLSLPPSLSLSLPHSSSRHATPRNTAPHRAMASHDMPRHATPRHVTPCHATARGRGARGRGARGAENDRNCGEARHICLREAHLFACHGAENGHETLWTSPSACQDSRVASSADRVILL